MKYLMVEVFVVFVLDAWDDFDTNVIHLYNISCSYPVKTGFWCLFFCFCN